MTPKALRGVAVLIMVAGLTILVPRASGADSATDSVDGVPRLDPSDVVTAEACSECHAATYDAWRETKHATGFQTTHRQQNAYDIAERMGFRLIKRDSMCLECHFTPIREEGELRAVSGVSCESCHGAGHDYIDVHNDYGGQDVDHRTESAEHRAQRIAASRAAGMRRPSDLYELVSTCYGCHTVPNEKLVNVGRHSLGSADFDLVARTLEIRHNFLDSYLNGDGTVNAQRSREHLRRLAVTGRMLAVEYALRGMAQATEDGVYAKAMERRLRGVTRDLYQVAHAADLDEARRMVEVARTVDAEPGARAPLLAAADRVGELARAFVDGHDGTRLAAVEPLLDGGELPYVELPPTEAERLAAEQEARLAEATGSARGDAPATATSAPNNATTADTTAATTAVPAIDAIPAEGERRSHIRPRSSHETLEVSACQKCHGDQNAWWFRDRHFATIEPFLDRAPKNVRIARLYGLSPSQMARGDSLCMDCHGTISRQVATGGGAREVEDGVSCQSCHGPAADYLEVHPAEEGESLGPDRPGYRQAVRAGMNDLRDLGTAVANCASCHYVNDRRLLSAGHPSGQDFDIASSMSKIQHWETAVLPAADLRRAWAAVRVERGPVPDVQLARLATPARTVRAASSTAPAGSADGTATDVSPAAAASGAPESDIAFAEPADGTASAAPLPERPELAPDASVDEVLRAVQQRLEELYRATGGSARATERDRDDADDAGNKGDG